jgi:MHS family proline/betaine transporter-like MFS transporter
MGRLSDRIGRKPLFYFTSAGSALLAYPLFALLVTLHSAVGLFLTQAIAAVILTGYTGAIVSMLAEMFPTSIRYTAISVCYGVAISIFGGLAPLISTALVKYTGNPIAPAYYVIFAGILSFVSTTLIKEGAGLPLPKE